TPRRGPLDARDAAPADPDGARHPPLPGDLRDVGGRRGPLRAHRRPPLRRLGGRRPERPPPGPAGDPQGGRLRALLAHPPGRPGRRRPRARRGDPALSEPPARRPLITGEGRFATEGWLEVRAPGDGELLAEVAAALPEDVDRAARAADAAWPAWAALPPSGRARALEAYA